MIPGSRGWFKRGKSVLMCPGSSPLYWWPIVHTATNGSFADTSVLAGVLLVSHSSNPPSNGRQSPIRLIMGSFADTSVLAGMPTVSHPEIRQIISPRIIHSMLTMLVYILMASHSSSPTFNLTQCVYLLIVSCLILLVRPFCVVVGASLVS